MTKAPVRRFLLLPAILCLASLVFAQSYTISTVAGASRPPDGSPATSVPLRDPWGVAQDAAGNIYIADANDQRVRRVASDGKITTIAGDGVFGFSGDGGPATSARLGPTGLRLDGKGNLFICDWGNERVRKLVLSSGIITTVAGNGSFTYSGDKGPATQAGVDPIDIAVDGEGNLYIADYLNHRIRKVAASDGTITTIAGTGEYGSSGADGPALATQLSYPEGISVDAQGMVYFVDFLRVRRIDQATGVISTVAGTGFLLRSTAVEANGDLLILTARELQRVTMADGKIHLVAGDPDLGGFEGDGGNANAALFQWPAYVAAAPNGDVLVADLYNFRVRRLRAGAINTVAGVGAASNIAATSAFLNLPRGVAPDGQGGFGISDNGHNRVRIVSAAGMITDSLLVSTNNSFSFGPPGSPQGIARDAQGFFYFADSTYGAVRRYRPGSSPTTVAGDNGTGFSGDNGPAAKAKLSGPVGVAVDTSGNAYIADRGNCRVRQVDAAGIITTLAGTGSCAFSGDNGSAAQAGLDPFDVAVGGNGSLYIADRTNHRIRKIDLSTKIITTVAGTGASGYSGNGGPATSAQLRTPTGVAVDAAGNLYIADYGNNYVRVVRGNTISTIAGTGNFQFDVETGPATGVSVDPYRVAVSPDGSIYVVDRLNDRIRKMTAAVSSSLTIASGDGQSGPAGKQVTIAVKIAGASGVPLAGVTVNFSVASGSAQLSATAVQTALDGTASVQVTLGTQPGPVRILAASSGLTSVTFNLTVTPPVGTTCTASTPSITSVRSASDFGGFSTFAAGSWLEIKGANLATTTRQWTGGDFSGVNAPTSLDGVSVSSNSRSGFVYYISPAQINVQAPADPATGAVQITVTNCAGSSAPMTVQEALRVPGMLAPASFNIGGKQYLAALFEDGVTFVGNTDLIQGVPFRPAKPNDSITAYGIGFGDVTPASAPGVIVGQENSIPSLTIRFGQTQAVTTYAGLAPGNIGLYQFNITVPEVPDGDYTITVEVGGLTVPQSLFLTVHR